MFIAIENKIINLDTVALITLEESEINIYFAWKFGANVQIKKAADDNKLEPGEVPAERFKDIKKMIEAAIATGINNEPIREWQPGRMV